MRTTTNRRTQRYAHAFPNNFQEATQEALGAIKAARLYHASGRYITAQHVAKAKVPTGLYRVARQLEAVRKQELQDMRVQEALAELNES